MDGPPRADASAATLWRFKAAQLARVADLCETLRSAVPERGGLRKPASVDAAVHYLQPAKAVDVAELLDAPAAAAEPELRALKNCFLKKLSGVRKTITSGVLKPIFDGSFLSLQNDQRPAGQPAAQRAVQPANQTALRR